MFGTELAVLAETLSSHKVGTLRPGALAVNSFFGQTTSPASIHLK